MQDYADGFRLRSGIEIETRIPPDLGRLNRDMEMTIFRIIQEGLANIHRHSESTVATITLERDAREIRLELADRGRGLPTALTGEKGMPRLGVGIQSMRERAELLGGSLQISFTESGTRLTLVLPLLQP